MNEKRRAILAAAGAALLAGVNPAKGQGSGRKMRIGVIGAGRVGGTIGELWVKAGHEVVLISIPYAALPQVGRDLADALKGKVVLETGNPYPQRDGNMAIEARAKGTGAASAEFLPGVRLVRAFNSVGDVSLRSQAHRRPPRVAIPLAADDAEAMKIAAQLVEDAGFEPVPVGPLSRAREFDFGTRVYGYPLTARELRRDLGIK